MKDQIIPHILRDRIIMYIKKNNPTLSQQEKADNVQEIFETYFKLLNTNSEDLNIYALYFSTLTNYNTSKWMRQRLSDKDEDKAKIYDFIKSYAYSKNFEVRWKKDMSNVLSWRYNQKPHLQEDLDRLVFMLAGKTLVDIREEVRQLNS